MKKKTVLPELEKRLFLEELLSDKSGYLYSNLPQIWQVENKNNFSKEKELYVYQQRALQRIASVLYAYYSEECQGSMILNLMVNYEAKRHDTLRFFSANRACFWMATGSGKTLVLIKTIEHIDRLMRAFLIPKKQIMILLPKDDIIAQFQSQLNEFNQDRNRKIRLVSLKNYEDQMHTFSYDDDITVFYYRSDLLRDERKESILNYKDYENDGDWYLFLDEAHRGNSEDSNLKEYVKSLSKNGFLFNFSATFIEPIDIATTCYNFNLEKFIKAGYGKNILISNSNYTLNDRQDDFSIEEKQKQVLKSFIIFTLIKKNKEEGFYHNPLMLTLVNTVNAPQKGKIYKVNSDLSLFCSYMLKIANDDESLAGPFEAAKSELEKEFAGKKLYQFGSEVLNINNIFGEGKSQSCFLRDISIKDIREAAFNSETKGALEYYEGEKGKEVVFKLQTAQAPFALIKIGDAKTFIKNYLTGFSLIKSFEAKNYFASINDGDCPINILLGSRAFYEGWDSNRPNIINLINIGSGDAKKFIPQSIGRGIRIQPDPNDASKRQRLEENNKNKNALLETLFIFPTDKKSVEQVLGAMAALGGEGNKECRHTLELSLFQLNEKKFDLLVPQFKDSAESLIGNFLIDKDCKEKFCEIFNKMTPATFLLQSCASYINKWTLAGYNTLNEQFVKNDKPSPAPKYHYDNYDVLLSSLRQAVVAKQKVTDGIRRLKEDASDESDIVHFRHIEVNLTQSETSNLQRKIKSVNNFGKYSQDQILKLVTENGKINFAKAAELQGGNKSVDTFSSNDGQALNIAKLAEHYYLPILYAEDDKIDFITHIIKENSEIAFIKALIAFLNSDKSSEYDWMFSKLDESVDKIFIPYSEGANCRSFYPDFIFWQKSKTSDDYKITFVDPKGTQNSSYQFKVDGFKKLFFENGAPKTFVFENGEKTFKITVDLKLVKASEAPIPDGYKEWWIDNGDFSWLER